MNYRTVLVNLHSEEFDGLYATAAKHNVSVSAYLRSIVVDALVEEGFTFVQRGGTKGRSKGGEKRELGGATTS